MTRKSFIEHLNEPNDKLPTIKRVDAGKWGSGKMVIPQPKDVDELMKKVPKGKVVTINEIRAALTKKYRADFACPLTTGIFVWIAAGAADEESSLGKKTYTPWWRTLKTGGELNPKYPGGIANQKKLLEQEGHKVIQKGKKTLVFEHENVITKLT